MGTCLFCLLVDPTVAGVRGDLPVFAGGPVLFADLVLFAGGSNSSGS